MIRIILTNINFIKDFFNKGHERTINAKKNVLASFAIKGISIVISLILVPLTIDYINPTKYGIWLTLSSIIAWFSFFDIGFGNGLRNKLAETKANGDFYKGKIYVSTTYAILTLIFSFVLILFIIINKYLNWSIILNAPIEMNYELSKLAIIIFTFFCIQIVLKVINIILISDQKPAKAAFFDMLGQSLALVLIFILTKTTKGSLLYLGFIYSSTPIIILIISTFWFFRKSYKHYAPSLKSIEFKYAKDLMKLGIKFFIIQIAGIIIYQMSNIIISQTTNPTDVAIYNIVYKYFSVALMVFTIIIAPFWTAYTDAYVKQEFDWMKKTYNKLRKIWFGIIGLIMVLLICSKFIYKFWIGNSIDIPIIVSFFMSIYMILFTWNYIHAQLLNGIGKIKLQLLFSLIGIFLNIPLSFYFGYKYGIIGVIGVGILLNIAVAFFASKQILLILQKKAIGVWNQ